MSVEAMLAVQQLKARTSHACFRVLMTLAEHANKQGSNTWPSVKTIAGEAQMDEKTARQSLAKLQQDGLIAGDSRRGRGNVTCWRLLFPVLPLEKEGLTPGIAPKKQGLTPSFSQGVPPAKQGLTPSFDAVKQGLAPVKQGLAPPEPVLNLSSKEESKQGDISSLPPCAPLADPAANLPDAHAKPESSDGHVPVPGGLVEMWQAEQAKDEARKKVGRLPIPAPASHALEAVPCMIKDPAGFDAWMTQHTAKLEANGARLAAEKAAADAALAVESAKEAEERERAYAASSAILQADRDARAAAEREAADKRQAELQAVIEAARVLPADMLQPVQGSGKGGMPTFKDPEAAWVSLGDGQTWHEGEVRVTLGGFVLSAVARDVLDAAGLNGFSTNQNWRPLVGWMQDGLDIHRHVIPLLRRRSSRPGYEAPRVGLAYFEAAVRERQAA